MRFVLASCPASTPPDQAFLLYTIPGNPVPGRVFTPVPCWAAGCSEPHPLVEVDATTALGTLTRAAESASAARPANGSDSAGSPVSVASGPLYGDPGAVGPAITSAAGAL